MPFIAFIPFFAPHTSMPPKKKLKSSTIANLWAYLESSTSFSSPPSTLATTPSTSNLETHAATPVSSKKHASASFIWDHGIEFIDSQGNKCWKCCVCSGKTPKILPVSSTSNQRYHLRVAHCITDPAKSNDDDQQTTLDTHLLKPFQVDTMRKLLVEWILSVITHFEKSSLPVYEKSSNILILDQ